MVGVFLPPPRSPGGQRPAWSKLVPAPLSPSRGPRSTAGQHPRPTLPKPILSQSSGGCHGNRCSQSHTSSARTSDRGCVGPGTGISAASCHRESLHRGLKTQPTKDTANPESHWLGNAPPPPVRLQRGGALQPTHYGLGVFLEFGFIVWPVCLLQQVRQKSLEYKRCPQLS